MSISSRTPSGTPGLVYFGIALVSAAVLMQEILLTRIFSFTIWYHLAYLTVSTALLGFGAAGSLLSGVDRLGAMRSRTLAAGCAIASGMCLLCAALVIGPRPLDPVQLVSAPARFSLGLLFYYVVIALPFLFAGMAVVVPLRSYPRSVNRLYAMDLFGAGLGCIAALVSLRLFPAEVCLIICAMLFIGGGVCYADRTSGTIVASAVSAAVLAISPWYVAQLEFAPAKSKAMGRALEDPGTTLHYTKWSPVNRVDIYETAQPAFTYWAGIGRSARYTGAVPDGLSLQYDAHNGSAIYTMRDPAAFNLLDSHLLSIPYRLRERPDVLVIGVGGGIDVVNAFHHGAEEVTAVELQPLTIDLLTQDAAIREWTGDFFNRPDLTLVAGEGRHFVRASDREFDLIQQTATDTFSAQTTGAYVLAESYLYTVEAMQDYLRHLKDDGVLTVVLGELYYEDRMTLPPLISRLSLAAIAALESGGAAAPSAHVMVVSQVAMTDALESWVAPENMSGGSGTGGASHIVHSLVVKKSPFDAAEVESLKRFAVENGFRVLAVPDEGGRPLDGLLRASAAERRDIVAAQAFKLEPVNDDRPFFFHVLPWSSVLTGERTIWNFPGSTTGQLILLIMLGQSLLFGGALIFIPLAKRFRRGIITARPALGSIAYFSALGIGFMLIEISFVQKYVLLLGYPTYSLSVTIFSLLIFAGFGAYLSERFWQRMDRFLLMLLATTISLVLAEIAVLPFIRDAFLAAPLAVRILVTVLLQFPLGTCLGMYFPSGVEVLRRHSPDLIPWAWAVNGVTSVVSLVLAVILGMSIGFSAVAAVAAGIYCIGTIVFLTMTVRSAPAPLEPEA